MIYTDIKKQYRKKKIMLALVVSTLCLLAGCQGKTQEEVWATVESEQAGAESMEREDASPDVDMEIISEEDATFDGNLEIEADSQNAEKEMGQEVKSDALQGTDSDKPTPVKVKGIYVSGPVAGIERMDELIALVDETELNAMVIDIKNDEGRVTYKMQSQTVVEIEAGIRYIPDMEALVQKCKEKDIYLIARIVAFKDPYLAEKCPELAVKTKAGAVFKDKSGLALSLIHI